MSAWDKDNTIGQRCILELALKYTKAQHDLLDKTFRVANDMKNCLIGWYSRQLMEMTRTRLWREVQHGLAELYKAYGPDLAKLEKLEKAIKSEEEHCKKFGTPFVLSGKKAKQRAALKERVKEYKTRERSLITSRNEMLKAYKFSKNDFEKRMMIYRSSYDSLIGSATAQRIADTVWAMFEAYLFKNGRKVIFSRFSGFLAIEGKSNKANIIFNREKMTLTFGKGSNKATVKVKRSKKDPYGYEAEALSRRVCYCRIVRKAYSNGWRYFVQLVLDGPPPVKADPKTGDVLHSLGKGRVGLDIGPQTLAYSAERAVGLVELAEGVQNMQDEIRCLKRAMNRSRKMSNPGMFYPDGQVIPKNRLSSELLDRRGQRKWVKTKHYRQMEVQLRALYRRLAALRKHLHHRLANKILPLGDKFFVEDMRWKALAKRAKKTRQNRKGKFLSKKRYGKSIANKAPGSFLSILEEKAIRFGGTFQRIVTWEAKASQFDHQTGKYNPKKLSQRWHILSDGTKIQRDLYSAFLIQHTSTNLKSFDQSCCSKDFPAFIAMHDKAISRLKACSTHLPSSMGIKKPA